MVSLTQCDEQELDACVQELLVLYEAQSSLPPAATGNGGNGSLSAVKKKFQSAKYNTVSCLAFA